VAPLTRLIQKDQTFSWRVEIENAFQNLNCFSNLAKPFVLEIDTFDFALGVILSQLGKEIFFHLINFYSCKFSPAEINYEIYHNEFLTIVDAFKEWCRLFEGTEHETIMYSNHNLQHFMTIHVLN
jgi:hypothetical protein